MRIVHLKKEPFDIRIDRATQWGNPWSSKSKSKALFTTSSREESVENFRSWLKGENFQEVLPERRKRILSDLEILRGMTLGCWCHPNTPCHGEVYIELLGETYDNDPRKKDEEEGFLLELFGV